MEFFVASRVCNFRLELLMNFNIIEKNYGEKMKVFFFMITREQMAFVSPGFSFLLIFFSDGIEIENPLVFHFV